AEGGTWIASSRLRQRGPVADRWPWQWGVRYRRRGSSASGVQDVPCRTDGRLSTNARGRAVFMWWAAVSRAVDQSSARNKRNDRLAEGHDRVAGAAMVLRCFRTVRP